MTNSSNRASARKPAKLAENWRIKLGLHPQFPLFPHQSGRWAKKVRQQLHYFGKIADDPKGKAALDKWNDVKDDLLAGRTPRGESGGLTVADLCNAFLAAKRVQVKLGKLTARSFIEYTGTTDLLVEVFGKNRLVEDLRPQDFETLYHKLARQHTISTLGREITHARSVFKYGIESDLIERAIKFGPTFKGPSKADKRKDRARRKHAHGARMFAADELRSMIDAAGPQLKAMLLLGANCGMGNTDCAKLPLSAVDLKTGWIDYPRPKTGIERRIPLWPETVAALRVVIDGKRPKVKEPGDAGLVFLTKRGQPWVRYEMQETQDADGKSEIAGKADDAIAKETRKLLGELGFYRRGLGFYALRHGFETVAGGTGDQVAVDAVMGHVDGSMGAEYREHIDDARLVAVTEHVRRWLYPAEQEQAPAEKPAALRIVG